MIRISVITCSLMLSLLGCASPANPTYYLLSTVPAKNGFVGSGPLVRVQIPAYLHQTGIALATDSHAIQYAKQHLWAEPVEESLSRMIKSGLMHKESLPEDSRVSVDLTRFHGDVAGRVVLEAEVSIFQCAQSTSEVHALATTQCTAGYDTLVNAMESLVAELVASIQQRLLSVCP